MKYDLPKEKQEMEGECGVVGLASTIPIAGKHLMRPLIQMHNRGNGKGGGIAAVGLLPEQLGVSKEILENDYIIQIAYLDPSVREEVEQKFIFPKFHVDKMYRIETVDDYRKIPGLEIKPPDVWRYFCRVKDEIVEQFKKKHNLRDASRSEIEDEIVYQNSFKLNKEYYSSLGDKKAFVLSHGKNMIVIKIVGYAEHVIQYYKLEDFKAYIWIGHQRYPTKGKVWHPGGSHPFIGMHEALIHNGDFANYYTVTEYLRQHNIYPLFLTDTEVSVLLFDLMNRTFKYPLEYIIEALAPTTERDFEMLPEDRKRIYKIIQASHIHSSPDGPWFFIIARTIPTEKKIQLIGITDTSMLRPQVFSLFANGDVKIGIIASEKQAIDAVLENLSEEDSRFLPIADKYWNARGGSYTDGGTFIYTLDFKNEKPDLICTNKFGTEIKACEDQYHCDLTKLFNSPRTSEHQEFETILSSSLMSNSVLNIFERISEEIKDWSYDKLFAFCEVCFSLATKNDMYKSKVIELLTLLLDRKYDTGSKRQSSVKACLTKTLYKIFYSIKNLSKNDSKYKFIDWDSRNKLVPPSHSNQILVIDVSRFPSEGDESSALFIVRAYTLGWRKFIVFNYKGQRFCGNGLGPNTEGTVIHVYGCSGDYLGSGLDGAEIYVHGNGQDQLAQIMKSGKLVIYGDVGQTFMYGAKGGEVYVLGNAAGRPLINAVGHPRVVINGTCLDYLAESFMAGDPLKDGGFVILNGIWFDDHGNLRELDTPYPGGNLFSLASGGAIYIRDPYRKITEDQLNGGAITELTQEDWQLIEPYLKENERLFGIKIDDLLTVDGVKKSPSEVYIKIKAVPLIALTSYE
ncbi:MAG: glutamate synthase [Candidatus Odinarchaeota archaeon]|nr:glutamate synthase [Candidatus Odinarchaeota archaeon]